MRLCGLLLPNPNDESLPNLIRTVNQQRRACGNKYSKISLLWTLSEEKRNPVKGEYCLSSRFPFFNEDVSLSAEDASKRNTFCQADIIRLCKLLLYNLNEKRGNKSLASQSLGPLNMHHRLHPDATCMSPCPSIHTSAFIRCEACMAVSFWGHNSHTYQQWKAYQEVETLCWLNDPCERASPLVPSWCWKHHIGLAVSTGLFH